MSGDDGVIAGAKTPGAMQGRSSRRRMRSGQVGWWASKSWTSMWRDVALARRITGDKAAAQYSARPRTRGLGLMGSPWSLALPRTPRTRNHEARRNSIRGTELVVGGGPAKKCAGWVTSTDAEMPRQLLPRAKLPKRVCRPVIRRAEAEDASSGVSAGEAAAGGEGVWDLGSWLMRLLSLGRGPGCASVRPIRESRVSLGDATKGHTSEMEI